MAKTRLIDINAVKKLITVEEVNDIVMKNFEEMGMRRVINPTKVTLDLGDNADWPPYEGFLNAMPAYIGWLDVAGLKWVAGFAGERKEAGLPYINAMIFIVNPHLGTFEAVLEGKVISDLRTGAQVPVILNLLGHEKGSDLSIAMFGTGDQAEHVLTAIAAWYNIKEVKLWNHRKESAVTFIDKMEDKIDSEITFYEDGKDAVQDVDAVITATLATEPIVYGDWIEDDTIIIPMGSGSEISCDLVSKADFIVVDHLEQAMHRGGLAKAFEHEVIDYSSIDTTFASIASGRLRVDEAQRQEGITIAVPVGLGAHDIAVAGVIAKRAKEKDIGEIFEFSPF